MSGVELTPDEELNALLAKAKERVKAMSPKEYADMVAVQARSFARGMAPCEHGIADWEECKDCRAALSTKTEGGE